MKIAYVTSEAAPYASTGGLGDVSAALPHALARAGAEIWRVMPLYRQVAEGPASLSDTGMRFDLPLGHDVMRAEIWSARERGITTYFVRRDEFFDRRNLYSLPERDYDDNFVRFTFFQKAAVALIEALNDPVDIVHCNDWQAGLVPLLLDHGVSGVGRRRFECSLFTIHNLAYQGIFPGEQFYFTNLPLAAYTMECLEYYGRMNFLKGGVTRADRVTTVSETYAREILTEEGGFGLHGLLASLSTPLVGIVNGVDYSVWDPADDRQIPHAFDATDLTGKRKCKAALRSEMKLADEPDRPLFGMITRLVEQKGLDILAEALPALMEEDVQFVLLGTGREEYQRLCRYWAKRWPERFAVALVYDQGLAHRIEAACDIYLMPSRYEPCGLNQLYSMRYGAVPVVHATGGLEDTVIDASDDPVSATGFKFRDYSAEALLDAIKRALKCRRNAKLWDAMVRRGMTAEFSWDRSAAAYMNLYSELLGSSPVRPR